jgi:hypothetical protein
LGALSLFWAPGQTAVRRVKIAPETLEGVDRSIPPGPLSDILGEARR